MTAAEPAPKASPPGYRIPLAALGGFIVSLLLGRRRSFVRDSRRILAANTQHRRVIEGIEHVPESGTFALVMNHFSRRGLRPFHCAMIVSDIVQSRRLGEPEMRWTFTSEYVGLRAGPVPIPAAFTRWLFSRVALVYRFVIMPRREELRLGRATALRELLRAVDTGAIAITPEGLQSSGRLTVPQEGVGRFLAAVSKRAPLLPVGIAEGDDGVLTVRFGEPFRPESARTAPIEDTAVTREIMIAIGHLLPPDYWGAYADELRES
jgi:hypothetical protein